MAASHQAAAQGHTTRDGILVFAFNMRRSDKHAIPSDLLDYARSVERGLDALDEGGDRETLMRGFLIARKMLGTNFGDIGPAETANFIVLRELFSNRIMQAIDAYWGTKYQRDTLL